MKIKPIDCGFYRISARMAKDVVGYLPKPGMEAVGEYNGHKVWVARTMTQSKQVWSMRECKPTYAGLQIQI